ncbi:hypothetical protein [Parapedobacter lycopersici]|uniref:hypothetical protein n=1 Tax=Parapedobacter lycopersici TaxID=1864939 RepID=UPI003340866E
MSLIRAKDIEVEGPLDRIYKAWLSNKLDGLRQSDKDQLTRMERVDSLIRNKQLQKEKRYATDTGKPYDFQFKRPWKKKELADWLRTEFGVSHRQAYIDIELSNRFFNSLETPQDREFARGMQIEWGEEMMARAEAAGDFRAAAAFFKELNQIKGLRTIQSETFDPSQLIPSEPILLDDPSKLGFPALEEPVEVVKDRLMKQLKKGFIETLVEDAEEVDGVDEEEI